MNMNEKKQLTNDEKEQYRLLNPLLNAIYDEFRILSSKKPNDSLNKYKVSVVNRILKPVKILLEEEMISSYLDILDDAILPFNSDVIIILSQYKSALIMYGRKYII